MSTKRKTRASESVAESPDSKRRKAGELESAKTTQALGYELLDQLKSARDKRQRPISLEFATLPDKEELPDYYEVIKLPIAFDTIEAKLKQLEYPNLTALESDWRRLVVNAKTYNEKDSEIHSDAEKIRKIVQTFMIQHNPAYSNPDYAAFPTPIPEEKKDDGLNVKQNGRKPRRKASEAAEEEAVEDTKPADATSGSNTGKRKRRLTLNGPRSTSVAETRNTPQASPVSVISGSGFQGKGFQEAQEQLLDDLLDFTNDDGVEISGPFANLPPRDLRDYYQVIKKPVSLRSIQKKVRGQKGREKANGQSLFTSWQALAEEMSLIWNNAREYNEEGSEIYSAAGELEAHFRKRLAQAKALVQEPPQPKVTLRVGAKEPEAPTKLKLHLSNKPAATERYITEPLKHQQDTIAVASSQSRANSQPAERATSTEPKGKSNPDVQANVIKAEGIASQSPLASSEIHPTSSTPAEVVAPVTDGSVPLSRLSPAPVASMTPAATPPRAPPPPPPRDPIEARVRASVKQEQPFRVTIPPSDKLSQQSVIVTLSESQRFLRLHTTFPGHILQRPHRIIIRLNREYLQPVQGRAEDSDPRSRTYDLSINPGSINVLDLEVLVSLAPRGAPKTGTGSEYDYERTTVYFNVVG